MVTMMLSRSDGIQSKHALDDLFKSPYKNSSEDLLSISELLCMK